MMLRGRLGECPIEHLTVDGAHELLHLAVLRNHHERGLRGNREATEHVTRIVAHLREREPVAVDEAVERVGVAVPGNTDELSLLSPLLARRLDRGGFVLAGASTGRPEPQCDRIAGERAEVESAATHQRSVEVERRRGGHRVAAAPRERR